MYHIIKRIYSRIPKKGIASVVSTFIGVLADRLYESYVSQTAFVGWPRIFPVLLWTVGFLATYFLIAFIYESISLASDLATQVQADPKKFPDPRKKLPVSEVSIGTFKDRVLAIDILAKVILQEKTKPSIEVFLKRIVLERPYCPNCQRTLDTTRASWMADGVQTGYKCSNCQTERRGVMSDIYKDVQGEIRRNFDSYWQPYSRLINELTDGKPQDFRVD
jgi:hypothetical protein